MTLPLWGLACLLILALITGGLYAYLTGRALCLPACLSGPPCLRTAIWLIATSGLGAVLAGVLLA
ncbi:MAG: hypothetical protein AB3N24_23985 [Leisingera sp.]